MRRKIMYDYPVKGQPSLSEISQGLFKIPYHQTTDSQSKKIKKVFREWKPVKLPEIKGPLDEYFLGQNPRKHKDYKRLLGR